MGVYDVEINIIAAIKDGKSLELFNNIGGYKRDSSELDLSHKRYYRRLSRLIATGLVKRDKGKYVLTALGIIVYRGQLIIQKAVSIYWNLKAIDAIISSGKIGEEEWVKLIHTIVDDQEIEKVILEMNKDV